MTGMDGIVQINTFEDIRLDESGNWSSGILSMTGVSTMDSLTLAEDGSAQFSGNLGDWTVPNWQIDLNPF